MLYDRLVLDVRRGVAALGAGDRQEWHHQLTHAEDIVREIRSSLSDQDRVGDPGLAHLYDRLCAELIRADLSKDAGIALGCLGILTDLAVSLGRQAPAPITKTTAAG